MQPGRSSSRLPSQMPHCSVPQYHPQMLRHQLGVCVRHQSLFHAGERLYPLIYDVHSQLAGKITGMLLEIDNSELLLMLESPESLNAKVGGSLVAGGGLRTKVPPTGARMLLRGQSASC